MIVDELKVSILNYAFSGKLSKTILTDTNINIIEKKIEANHNKLIENKVIKADKKVSKPIKKNYPYTIPSTWIWTKLYYAIDVRDGTHDSPKYYKDGVPLVTSKNLNIDGTLDMSNVKYISDEDAKSINIRSKVENDDILFAMIGSIGNPVIIKTEKDFCIKNVALLKNPIKNCIDNQFLYYYLYFSQEKMKKESSGGVQQFVSLNYLRNFYIPIPPIEEQQRIVDKIEELFAKLNELKPIEEDIKKLKIDFPKDLRKSLIQSAVSGKLTNQKNSENTLDVLEEIETKLGKKVTSIDNYPFELPNNWVWIKLGELVSFNIGKTPPRSDSSYWSKNEYHWVSISDMVENGFIDNTKEYVSEKAYKEVFKEKFSEKGTLLMSFKLTVGRCSILKIDAFHNEGIISIYPNYDFEILKQYLFKILPFMTKYGDSKSAIKGTTLNSKSLNNLLIPLPPIEEQQRIVDKLEQLLPLCDDIEKIINTKEK